MKLGLTRLYLAQHGICFHCPEPMLWNPVTASGRRHKLGWTREHIVPASKGGGHGDNIVLAHKNCNEKRGDRPPTEEMIKRAKAIRQRAAQISEAEVRRFSSDRTIVGTFASGYNWPISVGETKFVPPSRK